MEEDKDNASGIGAHATLLARKACAAYIGISLFALLMLFMLRAAFFYSEWAAASVLLVSAAIVIYRVMVLRSVQLYYDDVGVWLYSGILPWSKGVQGVKWRDMDEATFVQSFWSWLSRSYTIRIGHRFTKSSEIVLTHMARGKDAVGLVNTRHQTLIRENRLA
jgi:hypothetical protein